METGNETENDLAAEAERLIDRGIFLRYDQPGRGRTLEGIIWRPGKVDPLAEAILRHCHGPVVLLLDGHQFRLEPAG